MNFRSKRILLIEDDKNISTLVKDYLVLEGFDVDVTGYAAEALEQILKNYYDLIITDIYLPYYNGLQIIRILKSSPRKFKILATSGYGKLLKKALDIQADDTLLKPYSLSDLKTKVDQLINGE